MDLKKTAEELFDYLHVMTYILCEINCYIMLSHKILVHLNGFLLIQESEIINFHMLFSTTIPQSVYYFIFIFFKGSFNNCETMLM